MIDQEVMRDSEGSLRGGKTSVCVRIVRSWIQIAAFLIEKETITGKEFMKIFRECKGIKEDGGRIRLRRRSWKQK